eukprot:13448124-Ditylum_brightwellii.AAC.1
MRPTLHNLYEELHQQCPGYVWPCVLFKKKGKLEPKLKSTGKPPLHLAQNSWQADLTHCIKVIAKHFFDLLKKRKMPQLSPKQTVFATIFIGVTFLNKTKREQMGELMDATKLSLENLFDNCAVCGA